MCFTIIINVPRGFIHIFVYHSFCGSYVDHHTVFRIADHRPEVEFRCSSRTSAQPFQASYSSYNVSQRKHHGAKMTCRSWKDRWCQERNTFTGVTYFHISVIWSISTPCFFPVTFLSRLLVPPAWPPACPKEHFLCSTGLCVEKSRRCDGLDDCQDESDEVFCCA